MSEESLHRVSKALEELRQGRMVVVIDDYDRENEGDLVCAADKTTPDLINFMMQEGRGLICLSLSPEFQKRLNLRFQAEHNTSFLGTNFTESIALKGVEEFGITASGRAATILRAVSTDAVGDDFVRPGFVFPLAAVPDGVLRRRGQTEASVDLARLAGLKPAGVICEIMGADGRMVRGSELNSYCERFGLHLLSVQDVLEYRLHHEICLRCSAEVEVADFESLAQDWQVIDGGNEGDIRGPFRVLVYTDLADQKEHLCIVKGEPEPQGTLVRIHSECLTGDVFGSKRCDCGHQLRAALAQMCDEGRGVLIYLYQEGRGIGLANKLRAYSLQDEGLDTVDANVELGFPVDNRDYRAGAQILRDLGLFSVRLMTNNPHKVGALENLGIEVQERVGIVSGKNAENCAYLDTKRDRLGHLFPGEGANSLLLDSFSIKKAD